MMLQGNRHKIYVSLNDASMEYRILETTVIVQYNAQKKLRMFIFSHYKNWQRHTTVYNGKTVKLTMSNGIMPIMRDNQ